jgi:hypothetical protein
MRGKIGGCDGGADLIDDEDANRCGTQLGLTTTIIFCSSCTTAAQTW